VRDDRGGCSRGQKRGEIDPRLKKGKVAIQVLQAFMGTVLFWSLHEQPPLKTWIEDSFNISGDRSPFPYEAGIMKPDHLQNRFSSSRRPDSPLGRRLLRRSAAPAPLPADLAGCNSKKAPGQPQTRSVAATRVDEAGAPLERSKAAALLRA